MVRDFHRVIGREARAQILKAEGKLPKAIIACVGGGSNSIGIFYDFIKDKKVELIGVEAGGRGESLGDHAARFRGGSPGVLQGTYSYVLQDKVRPDRPDALRLRGPRLSVNRPRTRRVTRHRPSRIRPRQRRRSARSNHAASQNRRHNSRPGIRPRRGRSNQARPEDEEVGGSDSQHLRPRRQRHRNYAGEFEARLIAAVDRPA